MTQNTLQRQDAPSIHHVVTGKGMPQHVGQLAGRQVQFDCCNRAQNQPDAVIIGNPIAYPTHGRFKGLTNFLRTGVRETDGITLIVVGKAAAPIPAEASTTGDATTPFYVGNYRGVSVTEGITGSAYGTSLYHVQPATLTGGGARENGTGGATSAVNSLSGGEVTTEWGIRVLRVSSTMALKVQNLTRNTMAQGVDLRPRVLSDSLFQIGSGTAAFGGEVDISSVAIYDRVVTDAELNEIAAAKRKRMWRLGINV
jgi:hypothetical protein